MNIHVYYCDNSSFNLFERLHQFCLEKVKIIDTNIVKQIIKSWNRLIRHLIRKKYKSQNGRSAMWPLRCVSFKVCETANNFDIYIYIYLIRL